MAQLSLRFTTNLVGKPHPQVLEGREYLVFPVVLIREGVHFGSNGPTLYEQTDIATYATAWNHKPIVINHPTDDGGGYISADDPAVLEASKVGILMHNRMDGDKQVAEAWLEVSRLKKIEPRILKAADKRIAVEVSTGLFADSEMKPGEWNGEKYDAIARNYRPDHLALLPDSVGACSIPDGCGMFTLEKAVPFERMEKIQEALEHAWKGEQLHTNCSCQHKNQKEVSMDKKAKIDSLIAMQAFDESDREWLNGLEDAKLDKMVASNKKKQEEVDRLTSANKQKETDQKKSKVDSLIDSKQWVEKDREWLMSLEDDKLGRLSKQLEKHVQNEDEDEEPATAEEYIGRAPGAIREMLSHGLQAHKAERKRYTEIILGNKKNGFSKEELSDEAQFSLNKLRKLAALAVHEEEETSHVPPSLYIGNSGAPVQTAPTDLPSLELPTMNFDHRLKK